MATYFFFFGISFLIRSLFGLLEYIHRAWGNADRPFSYHGFWDQEPPAVHYLRPCPSPMRR